MTPPNERVQIMNLPSLKGGYAGKRITPARASILWVDPLVLASNYRWTSHLPSAGRLGHDRVHQFLKNINTSRTMHDLDTLKKLNELAAKKQTDLKNEKRDEHPKRRDTPAVEECGLCGELGGNHNFGCPGLRGS